MTSRRGSSRRLILSAGLSLAIHAAILVSLPVSRFAPVSAAEPMTVMLIPQVSTLSNPGPGEPSGESPRETRRLEEILPKPSAAPPAAPLKKPLPVIPSETAAPPELPPPQEEGEAAVGVRAEPADVPALQEEAGDEPALSPGSKGRQDGKGLPEESSSPLENSGQAGTITPTRYRDPQYPESARRNGIEGVVEVLLIIDGRGRVADAELIKSSGSDILDIEVLRTVRLWRFSRENAGKESIHRIAFRLKK